MANLIWKVDPAHSEILFKVKHLMITTVTGSFKQYDLTVETASDDFTTLRKLDFTADIDSIDTNNAQRDTHLKSADFFHAEVHGQLRFVSTSYEVQGDTAQVMGELTIKGITRPLILKVTFGGLVVDPYGQHKAGFTVEGKISRKAYGLTWDAVTEAGQVVVSDEIRLLGEIQLIKQAKAVTA